MSEDRVRMFNEMMSGGLSPMEAVQRDQQFNDMIAQGLSPMKDVQREQQRREEQREEEETRERRQEILDEQQRKRQEEQRKRIEQLKERREQRKMQEEQKKTSLTERMSKIVDSSRSIQSHTDRDEMPPGFAEYAKEKGMSNEEMVEFLAFNERLATGDIKISMHADGKGFDMGGSANQ